MKAYIAPSYETHLVVQRIFLAHGHVSNYECALACVFGCLELLDHEGKETIWIGSRIARSQMKRMVTSARKIYCC